MNVIVTALRGEGLDVEPLRQEGREVALRWDTQVTGPILESRAVVVLPDFHLGDGDDGDIFRGTFDRAPITRLRRFLAALTRAKAAYQAQGKTCVVIHIGDFYDVWRAYPEYAAHPTSDYDVIEKAYGDVVGRLVDELDTRFCVGNHDASLGLFPPAWARGPSGPNGRLAYARSVAKNRFFAFHGHQEDQIAEAMASQGGSAVVRITTLAARLANPLVQSIEEGIDLETELFSDPDMGLDDAFSARWPESTAIVDRDGFSSPRWSDRTNRGLLARLVSALPFHASLRLVCVGHSHRPGVSAIMVGPRFVPLVDVGSWVWNRTSFAVAVEGELRLYTVA